MSTTCCHICSQDSSCAARISIFKHLDPESQKRISDIAVHKSYSKGDLLFSPGNSTGLYLISEGKVKVYEVSPSGKEQLLRVLEKGDFVGEEALFSQEETFTFCEALTSLRCCFIQRETFLNLLMQYPSISLKLLEEFNRRIIHAGHQTTSNTAEPVIVRLVSYLLDLRIAQDSDVLQLPMQLKELAAFLSTSPETLSRNLRQLEHAGLVEKKQKTLRLTDWETLQQKYRPD